MKLATTVLVMALFGLVGGAQATVWNVTVSSFQFDPPNLTILQGDTVDWSNVDGFHNVRHICDPSLFGNDPASSPWTYRFVFNVPTGNYPYHCEIHPAVMIGNVTVNPRGRWDVIVQNFSFTPSDISITQGDTVVWTNISGTHSVHHTGNPSLFGNAIAAAPWVYSFVFNLPAASYPYQCQVHPSLMNGTVTVMAPGVPEPPSELVIMPDGTDIHLTWRGVCGALQYNVYRSDDPAVSPFPDLVGSTPDTMLTDALAGESGAKRFYQVKAE